jgi:2-keto-3-deoxy-L-rhamnonate aldolase RhmA
MKRGLPTFGVWLSVSNPVIAEIVANRGFDWVFIDGEHGAFDHEGLESVLMAFNGSPTVPIVRVAANDRVRIKQVLDLGADGVVVPMVMNAQEAAYAVSACKYPPVGTRGFGPKRASAYGRLMDDYVASANDAVVVVIQIEHVDAVSDLERILDVGGIDAICLGPADLSGSLGLLRRYDHPKVVCQIEEVIKRSKKRGLPVCLALRFDDDIMRNWFAMGANFVLVAEDTTLFDEGMAAALGEVKSLLGVRE